MKPLALGFFGCAGSCCCGDHKDSATQILLSSNPWQGFSVSTDEDLGVVPSSPSSVPPLRSFSPRLMTAQRGLAAPAALSPPPPVRPEEDQERAVRKARVQELVKSFSRRAVKGIECQVFGTDGSRVSARYTLESDFKCLRLEAFQQPRRRIHLHQITEVSCGIASTADIASDLTSPVSKLDLDTRARMVRLHWGARQVLLLEAGLTDAQALVVSLRVLRLYCEQQLLDQQATAQEEDGPPVARQQSRLTQ